AAEETRIGERALHGMVLADEGLAKALEVGLEHVETAGIVGAQARLAADDVERCALLRARLGHEQRPLAEVEGRERDLARGLRPARPPAKPPRDHQMKHEKEVILEPEDDPLAEAAQLDDPLPFRGADRHIDRAEEERALEPHLLER